MPAIDECGSCFQKGHWKKDCPKLKEKTQASVAQVDDVDTNFVLASTSDYSSDEWILDSACSYHMCPEKNSFTSLELVNGGTVLMGNDQACEKKGVGSIQLKLHDGTIRLLSNVWYVPELKKNLISVGALESKGFRITIEDGVMKISKGALIVLKGIRQRNLYYLQGKTVVGGVAAAADGAPDTTRIWHMRLGHASEKAMQGLAKQGLLKGVKTCKIEFCEHCVLGKQTRVKFGTAVHQTRGILDYVHSDVWGPTVNASLGGMHWFVTFVDDFSRRVWVYTMKHKNEVLPIFQTWKKMVETQTGRKIKCLRSDNGGEYTYDPFLKLCQDEGIKRHFTVRKTPQQNGVAERMNRTLLEVR